MTSTSIRFGKIDAAAWDCANEGVDSATLPSSRVSRVLKMTYPAPLSRMKEKEEAKRVVRTLCPGSRRQNLSESGASAWQLLSS